MNSPSHISRDHFFRIAEEIYRWDLVPREKDILEGMARKFTGSVVLDNWELFQKRFPGHPAWEFEEWYNVIISYEEEEDDDEGDS